MPYIPHDDRYLQKIAILPIPEAVRMLEEIPSDDERRRIAEWLARFWRGGVGDLTTAQRCVASSTLDELSKQLLLRGLED